MSEKCVYLLVLSGINLRNFHHCTKQRKMQSFGQKDVASKRVWQLVLQSH